MMKKLLKMGAVAFGCNLVVIMVLCVSYCIAGIVQFYTGLECETIEYAIQSLTDNPWQIPVIIGIFLAYDIYMVRTIYPVIDRKSRT